MSANCVSSRGTEHRWRTHPISRRSLQVSARLLARRCAATPAAARCACLSDGLPVDQRRPYACRLPFADPALERAATVLRLMYMIDMKDLQGEIDRLLVRACIASLSSCLKGVKLINSPLCCALLAVFRPTRWRRKSTRRIRGPTANWARWAGDDGAAEPLSRDCVLLCSSGSVWTALRTKGGNVCFFLIVKKTKKEEEESLYPPPPSSRQQARRGLVRAEEERRMGRRPRPRRSTKRKK